MTRADRQGVALIAGCLTLLASIAAAVGIWDARKPRLDPVTACEIDSPVSREVAVLIDLTDPISISQHAEVNDWFRTLERSQLHPNERVTVWTLSNEADGTLRRRFCRCRPTDTANPLIGNARLASIRSDSLFARPFRSVLNELPVDAAAAASPLLESVREILTQPEFQGQATPRRLVIVSNLEQNSQALSFYRTTPSFDAFHGTTMYIDLAVDVRAVSVDILFLPRGRAATSVTDDLPVFWRQYFLACGAKSVRIHRM